MKKDLKMQLAENPLCLALLGTLLLSLIFYCVGITVFFTVSSHLESALREYPEQCYIILKERGELFEYIFGWRFLFLVIILLILTAFAYPRVRRYLATYRFRKSETGIKLQKYVDALIANNSDLKNRVDHAVVGVIDTDMFQGYSKYRHKIYISSSWEHAASASGDALEMAKTTLCHELGHLLDNTYVSRGKYNIIRFFKFTPWGKRTIWAKEFKADAYGAEFYGNKAVYINKMQFMQNMYEKETPAAISDHPSWDLRIHAIQNDLHYSKADIKAMYKEYRAYLKKLKSK